MIRMRKEKAGGGRAKEKNQAICFGSSQRLHHHQWPHLGEGTITETPLPQPLSPSLPSGSENIRIHSFPPPWNSPPLKQVKTLLSHQLSQCHRYWSPWEASRHFNTKRLLASTGSSVRVCLGHTVAVSSQTTTLVAITTSVLRTSTFLMLLFVLRPHPRRSVLMISASG